MPDPSAVKDALRAQRIETPSWAFGNSGTRFKVFPQPGVPRTPQEKIADAAQVHKYTGIAPSMAIHIPWDRVDDYADLAAQAADLGISIGAVNANVFQDPDYMLGSVASPDPKVRRKAVDHLLECVDIMDATGFDFSSRFYADDDLMVGAADPFQLFRILREVVTAGALGPGIAFMLDQCHNIEPKIPAQIRSVMNVQEATAKALLVDAGALAAAQRAGDVLGANAALMDAYDTDVPLLSSARTWASAGTFLSNITPVAVNDTC